MDPKCRYLRYRTKTDTSEFEFEESRPYCEVIDAFVEPMRADICTKQHGFSPTVHCEFYREAESIGPLRGFEPRSREGKPDQ